MARGGRWGLITVCFLTLLLLDQPVYSQDVPTHAIILIDETAQEIDQVTGKPLFERSWEWAYDILDLLAEETRAETWVQILKFNRAAINAPFLFRGWKLLEDNIVEIKAVIPTSVDWIRRPRSTDKDYDYSVRKALCKAWKEFKDLDENVQKVVLLISDGDFKFITPSMELWPCSSKRMATILSWYKEPTNWKWVWEERVQDDVFKKSRGIPIYTFHYIGPANPEKATPLAHISIETGGRLIRRQECINDRIFHTLEKLLHEIASKIDFNVPPPREESAEGQREVRVDIQVQCDNKSIEEYLEQEAKCEESINLQFQIEIFLDGKLVREATWGPDEHTPSFSIKIPCEADYLLTIRPYKRVTKWNKEVFLPGDPVNYKITGGVDRVKVRWFKTKDAFGLDLEYTGSCGTIPPPEKRGAIKIDYYPKKYFNLLDEERNSIDGDEIRFDKVKRTVYLRVKSGLGQGYYNGTVNLTPLPDPSKLLIWGETEFEYKLAVVEINYPDPPIFSNLCWPPQQVHNDSFTAISRPIKIEGLPEDWKWDQLEVLAKGFSPGIPRPEIHSVQGESFDLILTIPSCSALQKSRINEGDIDGHLAFKYDDPTENHLVHFKDPEFPVDFEYREKWVRILKEPGFTIQGRAHKGDEWPFAVEFSPDLYPRERCVDITFKSDQTGSMILFEVLDREGNLSASNSVCNGADNTRVSLRIRPGCPPGHKSGTVSIRSSTKGVWLYCSQERSVQLQEVCSYRYDIDIPFIIEILNEKFTCPNIWLTNAGNPKVCELDINFGEGKDAPNWGILDLEPQIEGLSVTNHPQVVNAFKGPQEVRVELDVQDLRDNLKSSEFGSYPEIKEGVVKLKLSFTPQESERGIVELNRDEVPIEVDIRSPMLNGMTAKVQDKEIPSGEVIDLGEVESTEESVITLKLTGGNEIFAQLPQGRRGVTITCDRDGEIGHFEWNGQDCGKGIKIVVNPHEEQQVGLRISKPFREDPEGTLIVSPTDPDVLGGAEWRYRFTVKPMTSHCNWPQGKIEKGHRIRRGVTVAKCQVNKPIGVNTRWTIKCEQEESDFQILANGKTYDCNNSFIGADFFEIKSKKGAEVGKRTSEIKIFKSDSWQLFFNAKLTPCFLSPGVDRSESILKLIAIILAGGVFLWIIGFLYYSWFIAGEYPWNAFIDLWDEGRWIIYLAVILAAGSLLSFLSQEVMVALASAQVC